MDGIRRSNPLSSYVLGNPVIDITSPSEELHDELPPSSWIPAVPVRTNSSTTSRPVSSPKPVPISLASDDDDDEDGDDMVITEVRRPNLPPQRPVQRTALVNRRGPVPIDLTRVISPPIARERPRPRQPMGFFGGRAGFSEFFESIINRAVSRDHDEWLTEQAEREPFEWRRPAQGRRFEPSEDVRIPVGLPSMDDKEPEGLPIKLTEVKCGICLDPVTSPASTICGHIFCFDCIKVSQQSNKQCPACRTKLGSKQFHRLFM